MVKYFVWPEELCSQSGWVVSRQDGEDEDPIIGFYPSYPDLMSGKAVLDMLEDKGIPREDVHVEE